jgi:hypothetical protein
MKKGVVNLIKEEIEKILKEVAVSEEIKESAGLILKEVLDFEESILDNRWKELSNIHGKTIRDELRIDVKNNFFRTLNVEIRLVKIDKDQDVNSAIINSNNYGAFNDSLVYLDSGDKIRNGKIFLNIAYFEGDLNNNLTTGLIYHEILHYYEAWMRLKKYGNSKVSDFSNIKNSIQTKIKNECNGDFLKGLSEIIYYLCYFERNAFMATLYGELINTSARNIDEIEILFKKTKTYENYYINLLNPALIFNKEMCISKEDLEKVNKIIQSTINEYNKLNPKHKLDLSNIPFYYSGNGIDNYMNKILKLVAKEQKVVENKLPKVFKKILKDKQLKLKSINESDLEFNDNIIFPGRI